MVGQLSKLAHMVLTMGTIILLENIKLVLNAWWKHHGLPRMIVSTMAYGVVMLQPTYLTLEVAPKWWGFGQKTWTNLGENQIVVGKNTKVIRKTNEYWNMKTSLYMPKGLTPKFMSKILGPFPIVKQVFNDVYKLELLPKIKVVVSFWFHLNNQNPGYKLSRKA